MTYGHGSTDEDNYQLQWINVSRGGAAIGKCLVFDLFDNAVDAKNYELAFKGVGFKAQYFDHPTVKVFIALVYGRYLF